MLPDVLYSAYLGYKRDTDSIASWLAATAKTAGFDTEELSTPPSQAKISGGRPKGKARKEAKQDPSRPTAVPPTKHVIRIRDFTVLAHFIREKAIHVPLSFQATLDRAIVARAGFGAKLKEHGSVVDPNIDTKHESFVDVLRNVRDILESLMPPRPDDKPSKDDTLQNRFAGLAIHEPSEAFLSAPDIQRPTKPEADPVNYASEAPVSFEETIYELLMLIDDMNTARASIRSIWKNFRDGYLDLVPAAITTNTAIELLRSMIEDVLPSVEKHDGLQRCLEKCYMVKCMVKGFSLDDLKTADPKDNFNYDTYDIANESFLTAWRLIEAFQDAIPPGEIPQYRDGIFGTFDTNSDRTKKSGLSKFHDDRALLTPFFTDLTTVVLGVPNWPVHDAFLRGIKEMTRTGRIPFYMVFAAQVFLDVTYTLGPDVEQGWHRFGRHTNFIANDLKLYFNYHANLKIETWPSANDQMIKELRNGILWLGKDPLLQFREQVSSQQGVRTSSDNRYRIFRMSPVLCGLVLYQCMFNYREAGMAVAGAWGSIQYAGHLYNALQCSGLLSHRWDDMDIAQSILGPESFFVGGKTPRTLIDQFKKYCLQMGVSAAALSKKGRKERALASKAGPRGLKVNAAVSTMFKDRYRNDSDVVITAEDLYRITQMSAFEMGIDHETGDPVMEQIDDEQKLKEKKRLRHQMESRPQRANSTDLPYISFGQLTRQLANALQAETLEFSFPYMAMHRWCWRLFCAVRETCDPQLRAILGPDYLEKESQLPILTGYILMLACGAQGHTPNLGPLEAAAHALNEMNSAGAGRIVIEKNLKDILGIEVEMETDSVHEKDG
ncbi:hypothetical protein IF1G_10669 [Cordyceps javanica]|uniref:DUF6604 domain-containing protein n=1 Tax=Cordyceps javanica TaxID=43265 RepID=A0A545UMN0_9HYPO|nr:hypothetical protein IF1G_10669 [Cordyceps javanica]TQW02261.1 hypothetical protein IF2G_10269 [Cordyceps javanica]